MAGLAAFAATLQVSLAGVFRNTRPQVALTATPLDASARAKLAAQLIGTDLDDARATARDLALDALRRDPLQPAALRVLGLARQADDPAALPDVARIMAESQRLSRRDLPTQMWLIEYYGRLGHLQEMVHHFDLALRSSNSSRAAIFPLLTAAASDARTREAIIQTLSQRPNWAVPFAIYSTDNGRDVDFAAAVAKVLLDPADDEDRKHYTILLGRLAEYDREALAWDLYSDPKIGLQRAGRTAVRNGDFESIEDGTPFDWIYLEDPELWATRERVEEGVVLRVAAYNGRSGQVARQLLHLPAGRYKLVASVGDIPAAEFERPVVSVECTAVDSRNGLVSLKPARSGAGPWQLQQQFDVPAGCPFQQITVSLAGEGALREPSAWVDDIRIE